MADGAAKTGSRDATARGGFGARLWQAAKILFAAGLFGLGFGCLFVGDSGGGRPDPAWCRDPGEIYYVGAIGPKGGRA